MSILGVTGPAVGNLAGRRVLPKDTNVRHLISDASCRDGSGDPSYYPFISLATGSNSTGCSRPAAPKRLSSVPSVCLMKV